MQNITPVEAEIQASLFVYDANPDDVTKLLGIKPSSSHLKGDIQKLGPNHENSKLRYKSNVWVLDSSLPASGGVEDHVEDILKQLGPSKEALKQLAKDFYVMIGFTCCYYDCQQGFRLEKDIVRELADLNIAFDFDVYNLYMEYLEHDYQRNFLRDRLSELPAIQKLNSDNHDESKAVVGALTTLEGNIHEVTSTLISELFWDGLEDDELEVRLNQIKKNLDTISKAINESKLLRN